MAEINEKEKAKEAAAYAAVEDFVKSNMTIGVGSGSTIVYAVNKISQLYKSNKLENITCVPTSFQSEQLIIKNNLPLGNLKLNYKIDIGIDGADEVDSEFNS